MANLPVACLPSIILGMAAMWKYPNLCFLHGCTIGCGAVYSYYMTHARENDCEGEDVDLYTLLERAKNIAMQAHAGQTDKAGRPYIEHPLAVAEKVHGELAKTVALLHDVIEDSPVTLADIRAAGFGEGVIAALDCITKREGEAYDTYLSRVKGNPTARAVKLADLSHNMDLTRIAHMTEADWQRHRKYQHAAAVLSTD